ncbi:MAG: AraC family transcriptional regulator [Kiritimatiellae bacterium]|nr:AraC family transcriptional regulator [Kiritimatiellia bacterium]
MNKNPMKADLNSLSPYVRYVRINTSHGLSQAYIDPEFVFTHIFEGYGHFLLEGRQYSVRRGDTILMPPYMLHIIRAPAGVSIVQYIAHFDCLYNPLRGKKVRLEKKMTLKKSLRTAGKAERFFASMPLLITMRPEDQKTLERLFLRLKSEFDRRPCAFELTTKAMMLEILSLYLRNSGNPAQVENAQMKGWRNLEKAIVFIQNNLQHPLTLGDISRAAGLSSHYCCRLFKNYTRTTIHHYLNIARIQKAKILIDNAKLNFSQIADEIGFSSVHLFSRVFKKTEGMPPGDYAKLICAGHHPFQGKTGAGCR